VSKVRALLLVLAVGTLGAIVPQGTAQASGLCATGIAHRNMFYNTDGSVDAVPEAVTAVRVGTEVREWRDCTTKALVYTDAITCFERYGPYYNLTVALKIDSAALYREDAYFLADDGSGYAYENYRDSAGPAKICLDSRNVSTVGGSWAAYASYLGSYTVRTDVEHNWGIRGSTYNTPARYWWP
jgi:hypothetical protein